MMTTSIEPSRPSDPPIRTGDLITPELAESMRKPWMRAKWLTTTIAQVGLFLMFVLTLIAAIFAAEYRDTALLMLLGGAFAAVTGTGQGSQGWHDVALAKASAPPPRK